MKSLILFLSLVATTALYRYDNPIECKTIYSSGKRFNSVCNHYIIVNGKKFTIIDNGCKESKDGIFKSLKDNGCDVSLTFSSYREDWSSKK